MDYSKLSRMERHTSWTTFKDKTTDQRKILMTTKGATPLYDFKFQPNDILLMGRESAGVPEDVHNTVDARIYIPMHGTARSLNIVNAAAIACGEAMRQVDL